LAFGGVPVDSDPFIWLVVWPVGYISWQYAYFFSQSRVPEAAGLKAASSGIYPVVVIVVSLDLFLPENFGKIFLGFF